MDAGLVNNPESIKLNIMGKMRFIVEVKILEESTLTSEITSRSDEHDYDILKEKIIGLESENKFLEEQFNQAKEKIQIFEDQIAQKITHGKSISDVQERILWLVAQENSTTEEIYSSAGISKPLAEFHLNILSDLHQVYGTYNFHGASKQWYITQVGRKYLVSRNLLT
jgi:hypothetical protein